MGSDHLPADRIRQFMLHAVELTEDESEHINGWQCPQCYETMRKAVGEDSDPADPNASVDNPSK